MKKSKPEPIYNFVQQKDPPYEFTILEIHSVGKNEFIAHDVSNGCIFKYDGIQVRLIAKTTAAEENCSEPAIKIIPMKCNNPVDSSLKKLFVMKSFNYNYCYIFVYNVENEDTEWIKIGSDDPSELLSQYFPWNLRIARAHVAVAGKDKSKAIIIKCHYNIGTRSGKSIWIKDITENGIKSKCNEIRDILPFEMHEAMLVPVTQNGLATNDEFLILAKDKPSVMFRQAVRMLKLTIVDDQLQDEHDLFIQEIEMEQRNLITFGLELNPWFVFNDHLIVIHAPQARPWGNLEEYNDMFIKNYGQIYSFKKQRWVTVGFLISSESIDCHGMSSIMNHGVAHLIGLNSAVEKHYTMDLAKAFNTRNAKYYAIKNNVPLLLCAAVIVQCIFDYSDDDFIVKYFEKPYDETNEAMVRHAIWNELDLCVANEVTAKMIFDYIDEFTLEANNFLKPWE